MDALEDAAIESDDQRGKRRKDKDTTHDSKRLCRTGIIVRSPYPTTSPYLQSSHKTRHKRRV